MRGFLSMAHSPAGAGCRLVWVVGKYAIADRSAKSKTESGVSNLLAGTSLQSRRLVISIGNVLSEQWRHRQRRWLWCRRPASCAPAQPDAGTAYRCHSAASTQYVATAQRGRLPHSAPLESYACRAPVDPCRLPSASPRAYGAAPAKCLGTV